MTAYFSIIHQKRKDKTYFLSMCFVQNSLSGVPGHQKWQDIVSLQRVYCSVVISFFSFEYWIHALSLLCFHARWRHHSFGSLLISGTLDFTLDFTGHHVNPFWPCGFFGFSLSFHRVYSWQILQRILWIFQSLRPKVLVLAVLAAHTLFVKKATTHCSECCLFYFWLAPDSWITHILHITFH